MSTPQQPTDATMTLEKPVSKQSSMEIEEVSRLLDHESFQILQELQEALDGVDLEGKRESQEATKKPTVREDEEEDPESEEHELCLLMDSLVAELRADLQNETVQETKTKWEICTPTEGPVVPSSTALDVPVSDFTNHPGMHRLTDAQKELLQRLRIHLSHREPYKRNPEEDRVHQEIIPDLEGSNDDEEINWEPIPTVAKHDPDYVPVADFTPTKNKQKALPLQKSKVNNSATRQSTQTNAEQLEEYFRARSREEQFVEKWAEHDIWKQICRMIFPPDHLGGNNTRIPGHRTRLVE
jgi:hypothetical protein